MRKIFEKRIIIFSFLILAALMLFSCGNKIKEQMDLAKKYLNSGKYNEAKTELNGVLKEDSKNSEAKLLVDIITKFNNAKQDFDKKDFDKANKEISEIPKEYQQYNIKNDIENLKEDINKRLNEIKEIDKKINDISKLINDGNLEEANKVLNEIDKNNLNENQKNKIEYLKKDLNQKIEVKKQEEQKMENEKVEKLQEERREQEQKNLKKETIKQNISKKKETNTNSKNNKNTEKNVSKHYVYRNKELGLQITFPVSWKGLYRVETNNDGIYVYVKPQKSEYVLSAEGFLFSIVKKNMFNESSSLSPEWKKYIKAKGEIYVIVVPNEYSMRRNHPDWDTYYKLQLDVRRIINSIRAID